MRKVRAVVGAGVVLAAAVVGGLSACDVEATSEAELAYEGLDLSPLVIGATKLNDDVHGVALPVERPAELNLLGAPTTRPERTEVYFAIGTQNVMICQADDIAETSCAQDGATLIKEAVTAEGQTWQVILAEDEIQDGTADPADVIAWWTDVTYDETTPSWVADLAAQTP